MSVLFVIENLSCEFSLVNRSSKISGKLGGIYLRPGRTQTGTNLYRYEIFAAVYMRPEQNSWSIT